MMNKDDMTLSIFNVGNLSGDDGDCVQALTREDPFFRKIEVSFGIVARTRARFTHVVREFR